MRFKLPKSENLLFMYLLRNAPVNPEARTFEFQCKGRKTGQFAIASTLRDAQDLSVVCTLGSASKHVFMTVTDGDPKEVAGILAEIEDYDANSTHLQSGETLAMESAYMRTNYRQGVLLVDPRVSNVFSTFPETAEVGDATYHFMLVIFLNEAEYDVKRRRGLEALFEDFAAKGKDLTRISGTP